jgi:hypothetical protein
LYYSLISNDSNSSTFSNNNDCFRHIAIEGRRPKYSNVPGDRQYEITNFSFRSLKRRKSFICLSLLSDLGKIIVVRASYVALKCSRFLYGTDQQVEIFVHSILLRDFEHGNEHGQIYRKNWNRIQLENYSNKHRMFRRPKECIEDFN